MTALKWLAGHEALLFVKFNSQIITSEEVLPEVGSHKNAFLFNVFVVG